MVSKAVPPTQGSKYRIRVGQTIAGVVWSNVAGTVQGHWTIIYDDGDPDYWPIAESASGSSRAAVLWQTSQIAKKNGWVVGGIVGHTGATQRGQTYHQAFVIDQDLVPAKVSDILACGYVYSGHPLELGTFVEPGPAGGPGQILHTQTADPPANAEIANTLVPTGAIWLLRALSVQLVQGITQTPLPTLRMIDGVSSQAIAQVPITTTAISASSTAQLTWGIGLVQSSFTTIVGDEFHTAPLPLVYLKSVGGNDIIQTLTDGIGANTNYGAALLDIEEWVMPN